MPETETEVVKTETPPDLTKWKEDVVKEAVASAVKALEGTTQKVVSEETAKALEAQSRKFANAFGGGQGNSEDLSNQLLEKMLKDPIGFTTAIQASNLKQVEALLESERQKREAENVANREWDKTARDLYKARPDIRESEEAKESIDAYYLQTDPKMGAKERLDTAVRRFDKLMEKATGKSAEDRVKELANLPASGSRGGDPAAPKKSYGERETEGVKKYLDERKERFSKVTGGQTIRY